MIYTFRRFCFRKRRTEPQGFGLFTLPCGGDIVSLKAQPGVCHSALATEGRRKAGLQRGLAALTHKWSETCLLFSMEGSYDRA